MYETLLRKVYKEVKLSLFLLKNDSETYGELR